MSLASSDLHKLFKSTMGLIEFWQGRVRQGFGVDDASSFAGYVMYSGVCNIMRDNPECDKVLRDLLPYDGDVLWEAAERLRAACCQYYEGRTRDAKGTASGARKSDLEEIDHKLNLIAGRLAQVERITPARVRKPRLKVLRKVSA